MIIETPILNREHGIDQIGWKVISFGHAAMGRTAAGNKAAILVVKGDGGGAFDLGQT